MSFKNWYGTLLPFEAKALTREEIFQAGAASRDAEIQRLQMALADAEALELGTAEKCDKLRAELAAEQAKNVALREVLAYWMPFIESEQDDERQAPWVARAQAVLATQSDTSALEAIVKKAGEVMRDRFRIAEAQGWLNKEFIRALPAVTLEDLK